MPTRRALLATVSTVALGGCLDGDGDGSGGPYGGSDGGLSIRSEAFADGSSIPTRHTCDGADVSPALSLDGVPSAAESLALVVDDPDAPTADPFVHWLLWNVPPDVGEIPAEIEPTGTVDALDGAVQGTNDFDEVGYRGPCPPEGDGPHTYRFEVRALESELDVEPGAERSDLSAALQDRGLARATLTGEYER